MTTATRTTAQAATVRWGAHARIQPDLIGAVVLLMLGGGLFTLMADGPKPEVDLAGYATSLQGRTNSQRYNAKRSAEALDGRVVPAGSVFSFNSTVRSWTEDRGYVKAPVSYDGELVKAYGGGVCQTSTTLYNAALLAGMEIVERHPHVFAPHYVPPGRDAAVAQYNVDLRFKNPYPWPVRIRAGATGDRLEIHILGREKPTLAVQVAVNVLSREEPMRLTRTVNCHGGAGVRSYIRNPGSTGYRVVSYRIFSTRDAVERRERLADDSYEPMNRIVQTTRDED